MIDTLKNAMKISLSRQLHKSITFINIIFITTVIAEYRVGIGISDVTGPIVQIHFSGYASLSQTGKGIHLRQFARAFIIQENAERIVFVSIDVAMIGYGLTRQVLNDLRESYGDRYNEQNVILSATHTHSAPGGFMIDLIYDVPQLGFVNQTFQALRTGIVKAITYADNSLQDARIFINSGTLLESNINRSPLAYLLNPKTERDQYAYNVDKEMIQLKFVAKSNNKLLGVLHWFPVHPTSMNRTNMLVSSDNVGLASILFEQHINTNIPIGKGPFVAAFASTNLGDVSPNIKGPRCINTGYPCDDVTSSCDGRSQSCIASGPGNHMFESTRAIAENLFEKGLELLNSDKSEEVEGRLTYGHQYVNMANQYVEHTLPNGTVTKVRGCVPALGYSFAAGTTDGPGGFDFTQASVTSSLPWDFLTGLLAKPSKGDIDCHYPKPIFLTIGRINIPYRWKSSIVSIQIVTIGNVIIAAVPGEFSTMSGRRLKKVIKGTYITNGGSHNCKVIIAGLSNTYSSYVVTHEEYDLQRYEAASTIFGPHTLNIYLKLYGNLMTSLMKKENFTKGTAPSDISTTLLSLALPVLYDLPIFGQSFGDCLLEPPANVNRGTTIKTEFVSGNPRNNLMHEKTYFVVERLVDAFWVVVATDANWETKMTWESVLFITGSSKISIEWYVSTDAPMGIYRIRNFGYYKPLFGNIRAYQGSTRRFHVI